MSLTNDHWNHLNRSKRLQYLIDCAFLICIAQTKKQAHHGGMSWDNTLNDFESILHKVKHLHCDARSLRNKKVIDFLKNLKIDVFEINQNLELSKQLDRSVKQWYKNYFVGLENYQTITMPSTRNVIFEFIAKYNLKKIKIHKLEYWNKPSLKLMGVDTEYFESDKDIKENDFIILGLPLHGNFNSIENLDLFLSDCDRKNARVLIDTCWFPLLKDKWQINFKHKSICSITCTMSKTFPIDGIRSSFRLVPHNEIHQKDIIYNTNKLTSWLMINLLENFNINFIVNEYKHLQNQWCKHLELKPSPSVHNCYATPDIVQYDEHKVITQDGIAREKFLSLIYIMENSDQIIQKLGFPNDI